MISKEKFRDIKPGDMVKIDTEVSKVNALEAIHEGAPIYGMNDDMIPPTKGHWAKVKEVLSKQKVLTLEPIDGSDVADYAYTRYAILDTKKPEAKDLDTKKPEAKDLTVEEAWNKISEEINMFIVKYFPDKPCMLVADYPKGGKAKEGGTVKIMTDME